MAKPAGSSEFAAEVVEWAGSLEDKVMHVDGILADQREIRRRLQIGL